MNLYSNLLLADLLKEEVTSVRGIGSSTILGLSDGSVFIYLPNHGAAPTPPFFKQQKAVKPLSGAKPTTGPLRDHTGKFRKAREIMEFDYYNSGGYTDHRKIILVKYSDKFYEGVDVTPGKTGDYKRFSKENIILGSQKFYTE